MSTETHPRRQRLAIRYHLGSIGDGFAAEVAAREAGAGHVLGHGVIAGSACHEVGYQTPGCRRGHQAAGLGNFHMLAGFTTVLNAETLRSATGKDWTAEIVRKLLG